MSAASLMNTTVTISLEAQTKDATGDNSGPALTTVTANVPARVADQTPDRAMTIYGRYDALKMKRIGFASDPGIDTNTQKYWITWNGKTYNVTSVQNAGGNISQVWFVDVILKLFGGP